MGLINSNNNYMNVINASKNNITVDIYKTKDHFLNGLDDNFDKKVRATYNVDTAFDDKLRSTTPDVNLTVAENILKVADDTLGDIAANDANTLVYNGINGEWEVDPDTISSGN